MSDTQELELLEGIVADIQQCEHEQEEDLAKFKQECGMAILSATDELNDELIKTGFAKRAYEILESGDHVVYRNNDRIPHSATLIGGEEFSLVRFEMAAGDGAVWNLIFKPRSIKTYSHLVVPLNKAIKWFDNDFERAFSSTFGSALKDIDAEINRMKKAYMAKATEREGRFGGYQVQDW